MTKHWKETLPQPVIDEHPEFVTLHDVAWEIAHDHVREIPGMPQSPYMDESFCDDRIWIWDTCFMTFFCKYSPTEFPGVESFRNFLDVMHGDAVLPVIEPGENNPKWAGTPGVPTRILIHHPDNPPLFAWAEYQNLLQTGNLERVRHILQDTKKIQIHYEWLENLTEIQQVPKCCVPTRWRKRDRGYLWGGIQSGMDNTPRGRQTPDDPADPKDDFYWLDALAQQALTCECIAKMAAAIGDDAMQAEWSAKYEEKKTLLETLYWDERDGFYYDIAVDDLSKRRVITPASFWPLVAGTATQERAERVAEKVRDPKLLGGERPWVTLSRNDCKYVPEHGGYWLGAVWNPTAYCGLRALLRYGMSDLARETASRMIAQMYRTWRDYEPHTIWECYAPEADEPAKNKDGSRLVRKDFCGWSALLPIGGLIECVIGLAQANALENTLTWNLPEHRGALGCRNYRFGNVVTDLVSEAGAIRVRSNLPYTLIVNGRRHAIPAGETTI